MLDLVRDSKDEIFPPTFRPQKTRRLARRGSSITAALEPKPELEREERRDLRGEGAGFSGGDGGGDGPAAAGESLAR